MVSVPNNVIELFKNPAAVKLLITSCKCGQPHAIVCGSIVPVDAETFAVGEVLMKRSAEYMKDNKKVELVAVAGPQSFGVEATVGDRVTSGPLFDVMNENLAKHKLHANAVWTFKVTAVYDESAGPTAGKKIA